MEKISVIYVDQQNPGMVYFGTDSDVIYYGAFGQKASSMQRISVAPATGINWISYACERMSVNSDDVAGYLDEKI